MPAEYTIDKSRRMGFSKAYGIITDQEVYAHQDKLRDDPDFDPSFSQLVDSTNVTKAEDLSLEAIYKLARRNPFGAGSQRAFVASNRLMCVMFHVFQVITEEYPDEVVHLQGFD
jgi:hypothetical protein